VRVFINAGIKELQYSFVIWRILFLFTICDDAHRVEMETRMENGWQAILRSSISGHSTL
jgi:hypothetical protein